MFIAPYPPIEKPTIARCAASRMCQPSTAGMPAATTRLITSSPPFHEFAHSVSEYRSPFPSTLANTNGGYPSASRWFSTGTTPSVNGSEARPG